MAALLCLGVAARGLSAGSPPVLCHSQVEPSGRVVSEPLLELATAGSPVWNATRGVLVSPVSGLALTASRLVGMRECAGPPLLVTFRWPAEARGGTTVGDIFVTWSGRPGRPSSALQEGFDGAGGPAATRFGPNISSGRAAEERLGEHEVRHLDQWAVATALGGPAAFPVAYLADYLVFPDGRSHFERAAGLAAGDYVVPSDFGPAPLWQPLLALIGLVVLLGRHRLRLSVRLLRRRLGAGIHSEPGRCLRHTRSTRVGHSPR